jgi:hypothetical protein
VVRYNPEVLKILEPMEVSDGVSPVSQTIFDERIHFIHLVEEIKWDSF